MLDLTFGRVVLGQLALVINCLRFKVWKLPFLFAGLRKNIRGLHPINCAWENAEMLAIFCRFPSFLQKNPLFSVIICLFRGNLRHFFVILRHFLRKCAWHFGCLVSTFLEDCLFAKLSVEGAEWVEPDNQEYSFKVNFIFKTQSWDGTRLGVEKVKMR